MPLQRQVTADPWLEKVVLASGWLWACAPDLPPRPPFHPPWAAGRNQWQLEWGWGELLPSPVLKVVLEAGPGHLPKTALGRSAKQGRKQAGVELAGGRRGGT